MNPFIYQEDYPVVQTKEGALRGYEWKGTCIFKGIPYAHAQRFRKPERVKPWDGVKEVQSYGYVSPLLHPEQPGGNGEMMVPHMYWPEKEDCQNLNIWTPSIRDGRKRPVMVWLHGGGFSAGSSIEQLAYDGENLSRAGDVVVVSVNHRLNVLGYLDLSPFGEKYRDSANAGNLDLIAALEWIRDNIEGFGGDPENVTLFGQSGGGVKVWSLLQMPEADGLFHKGIIESGVVDPDLLGDEERLSKQCLQSWVWKKKMSINWKPFLTISLRRLMKMQHRRLHKKANMSEIIRTKIKVISEMRSNMDFGKKRKKFRC